MPYKDPVRQKQTTREYRRKNKHITTARRVASRKLAREFVFNYKKNSKCSTCGESCPLVLEFHNTDKNTKHRRVTRLVNEGATLVRIMKEIDRCQLKCTNCHRYLHYLEELDEKNNKIFTNDSRYKQRHRDYHREKREELNAIKQNLSCQRCGESRTRLLDFHHVDPSQKREAISNLLEHTNIATVLKEIELCVVYCGNCHRYLHLIEKYADLMVA